MKHSSQYEIGSGAWRNAKCSEHDCQGAVTSDHSARVTALKRAYPSMCDPDIVVKALADQCGPDCSR